MNIFFEENEIKTKKIILKNIYTSSIFFEEYLQKAKELEQKFKEILKEDSNTIIDKYITSVTFEEERNITDSKEYYNKKIIIDFAIPINNKYYRLELEYPDLIVKLRVEDEFSEEIPIKFEFSEEEIKKIKEIVNILINYYYDMYE